MSTPRELTRLFAEAYRRGFNQRPVADSEGLTQVDKREWLEREAMATADSLVRRLRPEPTVADHGIERAAAVRDALEGGENQPHLDTSGQSEWLICTDCHFVCYGDGPCHCTMEGKPGNRILVVLSPDRWLQTDAVVAQGAES